MKTTAADAAEFARFCHGLPAMRAQAATEGWSAELERALADLRAGGRLTTAMKVVNDLLGLPSQQRGYVAVPGQESAPPPAGSYLCPSRRCARVAHRPPSSPVPECAVFGEPLSFG